MSTPQDGLRTLVWEIGGNSSSDIPQSARGVVGDVHGVVVLTEKACYFQTQVFEFISLKYLYRFSARSSLLREKFTYSLFN